MSSDVGVLVEKNLQPHFFWIGCKWFKDAEPLQRNILLFTTKFPRVTHLIDFEKMNELVDHKKYLIMLHMPQLKLILVQRPNHFTNVP